MGAGFEMFGGYSERERLRFPSTTLVTTYRDAWGSASGSMLYGNVMKPPPVGVLPRLQRKPRGNSRRFAASRCP